MLYLLFSVTTSLTALFILMRPVLNSLSNTEPLNLLIQYKGLAYFVFFIMGVLVAPLLLLPTIIPNLNDTFKDTLLETIKDSK